MLLGSFRPLSNPLSTWEPGQLSIRTSCASVETTKKKKKKKQENVLLCCSQGLLFPAVLGFRVLSHAGKAASHTPLATLTSQSVSTAGSAAQKVWGLPVSGPARESLSCREVSGM